MEKRCKFAEEQDTQEGVFNLRTKKTYWCALTHYNFNCAVKCDGIEGKKDCPFWSKHD
jgi:hypothetical protein